MIRQRSLATRVDIVLAVGRLPERGIQAFDYLLARSVQSGALLRIDADDVLRTSGNLLYFHWKLARKRGANLVHRRPIGETDGDQRSTSKVDAVARAAFNAQTDKPCRCEDQGEDDERPLFAEKVKI